MREDALSRVAQLAALLLPLSLGCAGTVDIRLHAQGPLEGPVSLTGTVLAADGRALALDEGLTKIADFERRRRFPSVLLMPLGTPAWDLTEAANAALSEAGGDALVNVEVEAVACPYIGLAAVLPIIPAYVEVILTGDIVKATAAP